MEARWIEWSRNLERFISFSDRRTKRRWLTDIFFPRRLEKRVYSHTCRLIIRMRDFSESCPVGLWTCPITRTGFCVPPPRITTEEYRSHYAAVSRNLHVTFSCIFPRDLSAGTFKLLTKKRRKSKKKGIEERTMSRILFVISICNCYVAIQVSALFFSLSSVEREERIFEGGY